MVGLLSLAACGLAVVIHIGSKLWCHLPYTFLVTCLVLFPTSTSKENLSLSFVQEEKGKETKTSQQKNKPTLTAETFSIANATNSKSHRPKVSI